MERKTEITIPLMQGVKASKVEIDYENNKVIAFYEEESEFKEGNFIFIKGDPIEFWSIGIFKSNRNVKHYNCHSLIAANNIFNIHDWLSVNGRKCMIATPKQKSKLLYEMNKNGYYWDAENKKVEKLEFDLGGNKIAMMYDELGILFNGNKQILSCNRGVYTVADNAIDWDIPYYFKQTKVEDLKDGDLFLLECTDISLNILIGCKYYYEMGKSIGYEYMDEDFVSVLKVMPYERD